MTRPLNRRGNLPRPVTFHRGSIPRYRHQQAPFRPRHDQPKQNRDLDRRSSMPSRPLGEEPWTPTGSIPGLFFDRKGAKESRTRSVTSEPTIRRRKTFPPYRSGHEDWRKLKGIHHDMKLKLGDLEKLIDAIEPDANLMEWTPYQTVVYVQEKDPSQTTNRPNVSQSPPRQAVTMVEEIPPRLPSSMVANQSDTFGPCNNNAATGQFPQPYGSPSIDPNMIPHRDIQPPIPYITLNGNEMEISSNYNPIQSQPFVQPINNHSNPPVPTTHPVCTGTHQFQTQQQQPHLPPMPHFPQPPTTVPTASPLPPAPAPAPAPPLPPSPTLAPQPPQPQPQSLPYDPICSPIPPAAAAATTHAQQHDYHQALPSFAQRYASIGDEPRDAGHTSARGVTGWRQPYVEDGSSSDDDDDGADAGSAGGGEGEERWRARGRTVRSV